MTPNSKSGSIRRPREVTRAAATISLWTAWNLASSRFSTLSAATPRWLKDSWVMRLIWLTTIQYRTLPARRRMTASQKRTKKPMVSRLYQPV